MKRRKEVDKRFDALDTLFVGTSCPLLSLLLLVIIDNIFDLGHVEQSISSTRAAAVEKSKKLKKIQTEL